MTNLYVFRHLPSGIVCTIPADWNRVGSKMMVLDEIEQHAKEGSDCASGGGFTIIGCIKTDPYPDDWMEDYDGSRLPDGWLYSVFKPSVKNPTGKIPELKAIPEKAIDRNEFKKKGLL